MNKAVVFVKTHKFFLLLVLAVEIYSAMQFWFSGKMVFYNLLQGLVIIQLICIYAMSIYDWKKNHTAEEFKIFLRPVIVCGVIALVILSGVAFYTFSQPHRDVTLDEYKTPQPIEIIPRGPQ